MLCTLRRTLLQPLQLPHRDLPRLSRERLGLNLLLQLGNVVFVLVFARDRRAGSGRGGQTLAAGCGGNALRLGRRRRGVTGPAILRSEVVQLLPDRKKLLHEDILPLPSRDILIDLVIDPLRELERLIDAREDLESFLDSRRGVGDREDEELVGVCYAACCRDGEGAHECVDECWGGGERETCDEGAKAAGEDGWEGRDGLESVEEGGGGVAEGGEKCSLAGRKGRGGVYCHRCGVEG